MELINSHESKISVSLRMLLELKSKKDGATFTINQLAKALEMPHSILVKLMHPDVNKRIVNPKIETLAKITNFFKTDGFNINIDDLISGIDRNAIEVQTQPLDLIKSEKKIPLKTLETYVGATVGYIHLSIFDDSDNLFAIKLTEDINSLIKAGAILVINPLAKPKEGNIVVVHIPAMNKTIFRKMKLMKQKMIFTSLSEEKDIILKSNDIFEIIGIVVQIQIPV